ncbi:PXA domain-containing protein [Gongronella butleri]|nr:PXA domain-containing protein [Gongronella butleri]
MAPLTTTATMTTTANAGRPLHLRLLFPHLQSLPKTDPQRNATPVLTQSPAIDQELFMYIAFVMRDFIHPWYHLVSQDEDLTAAIVGILTGAVQRLEQRIEKVDWTEVLLVCVPKLLTIHWRDYRQARKRLNMSHASGASTLDALFHGMQPHIALQQQGGQNDEKDYRRQLADAILPFVLDPDDKDNPALRSLIREILANIVIFNLTETLTDPYTIYMIICKLLSNYIPLLNEMETQGQFAGTYFSDLTHEPAEPVAKKKDGGGDDDEDPGLFAKLRRLQAQQQQQRQQQGVDDPYDRLTTWAKTTTTTTYQLFSFGYIALQVLLSPLRTLYYAWHAFFTQSQEQYHRVNQHKKRTRHVRLIEPVTQLLRVVMAVDDRPIVLWGWQMMAMFVWPILRVFGGGLLVDKFLEQTILHVLSEPFLVFYLRLGRDLLWPNGVLVRRGVPPTPLQREQMRIRAERLLVLALPKPMAHAVFGTDEVNRLQSHIHEALAPLQHKYINKHLMYLLIDLVLGKVFPELIASPGS